MARIDIDINLDTSKAEKELSGFGKAMERVATITTGIGSAVDIASKAFEVLGKVYEQTIAKAMGEETRAEVDALKERIEVLSISIGKALMPAFEAVVSVVGVFTEALIETFDWVNKNKDIIEAVAIGLASAGLAYGVYTVAVNASAIATSAMTAVTWLLNTAMVALPFVAIGVAITALVAGLVYWYKNVDLVNGYLKEMAGTILNAIKPATDFMIDAFVNIVRAFDLGKGAILVYIGTMGEMVSYITATLLPSFVSMLKGLASVSSALGADGVASSINSAIASLEGLQTAFSDQSKALAEEGKALIKNASDSENYASMKDELKAKTTALADGLVVEGKAQQELAKKEKEANKEGANSVASKANEVKASESKTTVLNKEADTIKKVADATSKSSNDNAYLANIEAQSQALDELIQQQDEYIKQLEEIDKVAGKAYNSSAEGQKEYAEELKKQNEESRKAYADMMKERQKNVQESMDNIEDSVTDTISSIFSILPSQLTGLFSTLGGLFSGIGSYLKTELENTFVNMNLGPLLDKIVAIASGFETLIVGALETFTAGMAIAGGALFDGASSALKSLTDLPKTLNEAMDGLSAIMESVNAESAKESEGKLKNELEISKLKSEGVSKELTLLQDKKKLSDESLNTLATEIKERTKLLKNADDKEKLRINNELEILAEKQEKEKAISEAISEQIKQREDLNKANEESTKKISDELTKVSETIANSFSAQIDKLSTSTADFLKSLAENAPAVVDSIVKQLPSLFDALTKSIPALMDSVTKAIPKILPALIDGFTKAFLAIIPKIPALISAIVKQIPNLIDGVMKIIPALILAIPEIVVALLNEIPTIIKTIVENMPAIVNAIIEAIPLIIQALIVAIPDIIAALVEYAPDIVIAIVNSLPKLFTALVAMIPSLLEALAVKMPEKLGEALLIAGSKIWEGLKSAVEGAWEAIKKIGSMIWEGFKSSIYSAWDSIKGFGKRIWDGLWGGLVGAWDAFKSIGRRIWDGLAEGLRTVGDFFTTGTKGGAVWYNPVSWFADGGMVGGNAFVSGDSKSNDRISAMLSAGEMVIPRSAVQQGLAGIMQFASNTLGSGSQAMATGGIVGGGSVTMQTSNNDSIIEELKALRQDLNSIGYAVAKNTLDTSKTLQRWDYNGLPQERV